MHLDLSFNLSPLALQAIKEHFGTSYTPSEEQVREFFLGRIEESVQKVVDDNPAAEVTLRGTELAQRINKEARERASSKADQSIKVARRQEIYEAFGSFGEQPEYEVEYETVACAYHQEHLGRPAAYCSGASSSGCRSIMKVTRKLGPVEASVQKRTRRKKKKEAESGD